MSTVMCLALIIFHEARGEPITTQQYVASVAIQRATQEKVPLCNSMNKPRAYAFIRDKKNTKIDQKQMDVLKVLASREIESPTLKGRLFFNERKLGKLWHTPYKPIVSGNLIFY